ncbi:ERCC4 domain-containing protein [Aspergillus sp. HF37]|nr:ERCC4 domain-containing protein [Aspergillus sp. HF37]
MPEVIDLISSTPPRSNHLAAATRLSSSPANPFSAETLEEDSLFAFDLDKPAKRRRVSDDESQHELVHAAGSANNVFLFSDEEDPVLPPAAEPNCSDLTSPPRIGTGSGNAGEKNEESDPIVFTSSAPDPVRGGGGSCLLGMEGGRKDGAITIDDDDDEDYGVDTRGTGLGSGPGTGRDEIEEFSDQFVMPELDELLQGSGDADADAGRKTNSSLSSRTATLLASLEVRSKSSAARSGSGPKRSRKDRGVLSDELEPGPSKPNPKPARKTSKPATADKEAKAREREAAKAQREAERQREKERKQKLKEEKAREKQLAADISEVNKLKVDKKDSTPEMIVDVASTLEESGVSNQTMEFMKRLGVECTFFESPVPNLVKWRRKVVATFNETAGYWESCPHHVAQEDHVLCLLTAQEFVNMVISPNDEGANLDHHVARIKSTQPACKPIYLIEGLAAWMRKNQNSRNRAYQAEVRRQMEPSNAPGRQSRGKKSNKPETTPPVDDDEIEDALLQLQVSHACLIHHTNVAAESAEWIKNFTEHVSTVPYRRKRMEGNDSAFCMDVGQVKTGEDSHDTFVKMLQEVNRVTASMAYGITAQYPSVTDLVRRMKVHGPAMLEDVKKSANKNGALTDSRIGPAASKRLYKVFMGTDPASTDI